MTREEKEAMKDKAIHDAMVSIENRVRHVYNQGFEEGRKTCSYDGSDIAAAYQRGLDAAWECARSLCDTDVGETREIFGMSWWRVFEKMSATEAIQKLKEYKQALIDTGTIDEPKQSEKQTEEKAYKSCETCRFANLMLHQFPCSVCRKAYGDRWQPKEGASE